MRKILVLRGGALGDFIVTLPALALLRRRWPGSRIELAGNATAAQLALPPAADRPAPDARCHLLDDNGFSAPEEVFVTCHLLDDKNIGGRGLEKKAGAPDRGLLDAVHSQHQARWGALYGRAALPEAFARWLGEFDLVVNYWPDPEGELRLKFPQRAGQVFLTASALPTVAPAAKHYCAPLRELGLETRDCFCRLEVGHVTPNPAMSGSHVLRRRVRDNAPHLIAIHPGSGSPAKNWPVERWGRLGEWLKAEHQTGLLIVSGEADSVAGKALGHLGQLVENLPLLELAARFAKCRLFLGHDSGVSHLAAACGVPCVLLFGPTEPEMWAPPASHVRVVRRGATMASIAVADVQVAVSAALSDRT